MSAEDVRVRITDEVTVVATAATGPTGATGAPGADGADAVYSDATPAALGVAAPGTADLAAREGHVHPMPSAADVGADPDGTAAGLVAAHVDDTTAAHDASAVSVDTSIWGGLSTDVEAALAEVYADGVDRVTALPELADGIGTTLDLATPGFAKLNRGILAAAQSPTSVNTTTAETVFLSETLPAVDNVDERWLRFMISGAFTNNSGSSATLTLRLKHAGGTVATWTWATVPSSASTRAWSIRGELQVTTFGPGFTLLVGVLTGVLSGAPAGTVADFGTRTAVNQAAFFTDGTDLALTVTGQMSVTNANTNLTGGLIGIEVIG